MCPSARAGDAQACALMPKCPNVCALMPKRVLSCPSVRSHAQVPKRVCSHAQVCALMPKRPSVCALMPNCKLSCASARTGNARRALMRNLNSHSRSALSRAAEAAALIQRSTMGEAHGATERATLKMMTLLGTNSTLVCVSWHLFVAPLVCSCGLLARHAGMC